MPMLSSPRDQSVFSLLFAPFCFSFVGFSRLGGGPVATYLSAEVYTLYVTQPFLFASGMWALRNVGLQECGYEL